MNIEKCTFSTKRILLDVDEDIHFAVKSFAKLNGVSLKMYILEALNDKMQKEERI